MSRKNTRMVHYVETIGGENRQYDINPEVKILRESLKDDGILSKTEINTLCKLLFELKDRETFEKRVDEEMQWYGNDKSLYPEEEGWIRIGLERSFDENSNEIYNRYPYYSEYGYSAEGSANELRNLLKEDGIMKAKDINEICSELQFYVSGICPQDNLSEEDKYPEYGRQWDTFRDKYCNTVEEQNAHNWMVVKERIDEIYDNYPEYDDVMDRYGRFDENGNYKPEVQEFNSQETEEYSIDD